MITQNRGTIAFAVCGSFCTLEAALQSARALTAQGWQLLPVMSFAARQDTRFGTGNYWKEQLEAAAGHPVLDTLQAVEPLGPRKMARCCRRCCHCLPLRPAWAVVPECPVQCRWPPAPTVRPWPMHRFPEWR